MQLEKAPIVTDIASARDKKGPLLEHFCICHKFTVCPHLRRVKLSKKLVLEK
jgi:hypothetical protein